MKVNYAYVSGYVSEDTGEIMNKRHPAIVVLDGNKQYMFPFTSEEHYGVVEKGFIIKNDGFFNTRIRTSEELCDAADYYRTLGKWKFADNLKIGDICEHYVRGHLSFLTEKIPVVDYGEAKITMIPMKYKPNENPKYIEQCEKNRTFAFQAFKIIEKAIFMNKIERYETSNKPFENIFNIETQKFTIKEKVDICIGLRNERAFLEKNPQKDKIEYIKMIEKNKDFLKLSEQDLNELNSYKKELIEEKKIEHDKKLVEKIDNLQQQKIEAGIAGNIEKYTEVKEEIEKIKSHLSKNDSKIDKFENSKDDFLKIESQITKTYKNKEIEWSSSDKTEK